MPTPSTSPSRAAIAPGKSSRARASIARTAPSDRVGSWWKSTSCVALDLPSGERIVFDAGTGLRALGNRMMAAKERCDLSILLSHYH
ncbi:MAG: hypothetical protein JNL38_25445, partial [Myxococcales bacterium]|nr:hypothetical protein [Myxococcales bacterium]